MKITHDFPPPHGAFKLECGTGARAKLASVEKRVDRLLCKVVGVEVREGCEGASEVEGEVKAKDATACEVRVRGQLAGLTVWGLAEARERDAATRA